MLGSLYWGPLRGSSSSGIKNNLQNLGTGSTGDRYNWNSDNMDWLRRNRRRLAVGGGVLGGLNIVGRFGTSKDGLF